VEAWPSTPDELIRAQRALAGETPPPWRFGRELHLVAGSFICFPKEKKGAGAAGDPGWAAAVLLRDSRLVASHTVHGYAGAPYEPGLLALREGPLLEAAVIDLPEKPEVLLVNATGRDHPRHAGLALHLGARLNIPTVGVTHRLLIAQGDWPGLEPGGRSPFRIGGETVGYWLRTRRGACPLAVHAAWRTDPETAVDVVLRMTTSVRSPEPLRVARQVAREARAGRRPALTRGAEPGGPAFPPASPR